MRLLSLILALSMSVATVNYSFAKPQASIVATVNGEMISNVELEKNVSLVAIARKLDIKKMSAEEITQLRQTVLDDLIKELILVQEAKKQKINITDADVEREIQNSIQRAGITKEQFISDLKQKGYDEAFYKRKVQNTLYTQRLVNRNVLKKIIVSNDEVLDYYLQHGGVVVGRVKVALIVYKDSADMEEYSQKLLKNNKNFTEIAKNISVGPYASDGGVFDEMPISDLSAPIQKAVSSLSVNEVSPVFDLNGQYAQVKVLEKAESSDNLSEIIDPNVVRQIQDGLRMQKAGDRVQRYVEDLEKKSIINIRK